VILRSCTPIRNFDYNEFCGNDRAVDYGCGQSPVVGGVAFVKKSQIEKRIRENGIHDFFGSPRV